MGWKTILRKWVPSGVRQAIQALRLNRAIYRHIKRVVCHRYGDRVFQIELADPLAAGWYDRDWKLPPEIALLRRSRLKPGATVFDLGAHQGVVALMLGNEVGSSGKVVAVEAVPHNAEAAKRNRDLNEMPWVEILPVAVAAVDGSLVINRGLNAQAATASDYAGTLEVPTVTIDTLMERYGKPDVIYLDVEGMELAALEGATKALQGMPDVFVEVHVRHGLEATGGSVKGVLAYFPSSDYEVFVHTDPAAVPMPLSTAPPEWLGDRFFLTALGRPSKPPP